MVRPVLVLFISLFLFSVSAQEKACNNFIDGSYIYPSMPGYETVRKGNKQESLKKGVRQMSWKVEWLNACEYMLTCKKVYVKTPPFKKGDKIKTTIVNTEGDCYTCTLIYYPKDNPEGIPITGGRLCKNPN